jgi:hypothetical protein
MYLQEHQAHMAGELDHWTLRNKDQHGHTPEEEAEKKRDRLLQKAHKLFLLKNKLEPQYQTKIFPSWERIRLKQTNNLKQWINTTAQSVHPFQIRPDLKCLPTPFGSGTITILPHTTPWIERTDFRAGEMS